MIFRFQSLSGFRVRCNTFLQNICQYPHQFQSLSGFRVRCNDGGDVSWMSQPDRFQSLSGFRVRCNQFLTNRTRQTLAGFNPYRVFEYVATLMWLSPKQKPTLFQSLSGFRVRCNGLVAVQAPQGQYVSIPIGFSSTLQPWIDCMCLLLQPSFNPYRVFEYVATVISLSGG